MAPYPSVRMAIAAGLFVCAFGAGAWAEERAAYYEVFGRSANELREAIDRARPTGPDGKRHDALTSWDVRWRYYTSGLEGWCAIRSIEVRLDLVTTLPRWTNEADAPAALVALWRNYVAALSKHEDGHRQIAASAAAAIRDLASNAHVPQRASCAHIGVMIDTAANALIQQYRSKERQYDEETDNGRTQGARFP